MVDEGFEETICMLASCPIHAALRHNAKEFADAPEEQHFEGNEPCCESGGAVMR
jgi:hypothetical protein